MRSISGLMEGTLDERISVVYYCGGGEDDTISELYQDQSPPKAAAEVSHQDTTLEILYENVRSLLDEDQGGFHEGMTQLPVARTVYLLTLRSVRKLLPSKMPRSARGICQ